MRAWEQGQGLSLNDRDRGLFSVHLPFPAILSGTTKPKLGVNKAIPMLHTLGLAIKTGEGIFVLGFVRSEDDYLLV